MTKKSKNITRRILILSFTGPRKPKCVISRSASHRGADERRKRRRRRRKPSSKKRARGKDFAQLAKQESNDPTAAKGGEVGWIAAGQMPAQIEKSIFSLSKGDVSDPVETPGGFQIFKVDDT